MAQSLSGSFDLGLERSCVAGSASPRDWVRHGACPAGMERHEAFFAGFAYEPHRHDTYAIGYTFEGVQSFGYRGTEEHSLPGHVMILHPDEMHDGHAGTDDGFRFRMLYLRPDLIRDALAQSGPGGTQAPLPFVAGAVSNDERLIRALLPALADLDVEIDPLEADRIIQELADALNAISGSRRRAATPLHQQAVDRARDYLRANLEMSVTSEELEQETGLDRYELARQFRRLVGTSPYRYLVMRRLDAVRDAIFNGEPLADAAAGAGFADQAHMTRHFKKAFGVTPGKWLTLSGQA